MSPRARRLARAWAGAGIATSFAAASHTVAGGHVPPVMLVLLSLALSGPLCMILAGRVLSRSCLLAAVVLSQGIFHLLFSATGAVTTVADHTHHTMAAGPALMLEAHASTVSGGSAMLLSHLVAAAATYGLMRHGEVAAVALLDAFQLRVRALWRVVIAPFVVAWPQTVPQGRDHVLTDQSLLRPVLSYRGPPVAHRRRELLTPVFETGSVFSPAG